MPTRPKGQQYTKLEEKIVQTMGSVEYMTAAKCSRILDCHVQSVYNALRRPELKERIETLRNGKREVAALSKETMTASLEVLASLINDLKSRKSGTLTAKDGAGFAALVRIAIDLNKGMREAGFDQESHLDIDASKADLLEDLKQMYFLGAQNKGNTEVLGFLLDYYVRAGMIIEPTPNLIKRYMNRHNNVKEYMDVLPDAILNEALDSERANGTDPDMIDMGQANAAG